MATEVSQTIDNCRGRINTFLQDVINDWSVDCQNKSDIELAKSLKQIEKLRFDLAQAILAYTQNRAANRL